MQIVLFFNSHTVSFLSLKYKELGDQQSILLPKIFWFLKFNKMISLLSLCIKNNNECISRMFIVTVDNDPQATRKQNYHKLRAFVTKHVKSLNNSKNPIQVYDKWKCHLRDNCLKTILALSFYLHTLFLPYLMFPRFKSIGSSQNIIFNLFITLIS